MIEDNPYTTPKTSSGSSTTELPLGEVQLASRWLRLGAACIDSMIIAMITGCIITVFFSYDLAESISAEPINATTADSYVAATDEIDLDGGSAWIIGDGSLISNDFKETVLFSAVYLAVLLALNGYLLVKSGQTIGKKFLNIQVVCHDTKQLLSPRRMICLRITPMITLGVIPIVGESIEIINGLFIFTKKKRCLHDYIANSIVIQKH